MVNLEIDGYQVSVCIKLENFELLHRMERIRQLSEFCRDIHGPFVEIAEAIADCPMVISVHPVIDRYGTGPIIYNDWP